MRYTTREALAALRRAPLLTFLSAAMVALALYVVGLFGLAAHNLQQALVTLEERVEIVAYLQEGTTAAEAETARAELDALPEVLSVRSISKERALEKARLELPEFRDIFTDLAVNPLPASLEIELQPGSRTPESVARVAEQAALYPFVEDVRYGQDWVEKLFFLRRVGGITALGLGAAFAVVAALIIGTAVRIAIFARRDEIHIMRLVGAKDGFIRRPFLLEGALTGLVGGVVAAGITYVSFRLVYQFLFELEWLPRSWIVVGILAGGALGFLASGFAIGRHLREV